MIVMLFQLVSETFNYADKAHDHMIHI